MNLHTLFCLLSGFEIILAFFEEDPVQRGMELPPSYFNRKFDFSIAKDADPYAGLGPTSPEVLHREAKQLQEVAERDLLFAKKVYHNENLLDRSQEGRLLIIAATALEDPALFESTVLVPRWVSWWQKTHKPDPFDTRLPAERYLAYVVDRAFMRVTYASDEMQFDKELDGIFVREKQKEFASLPLSASGISQSSKGMSNADADPCPQNDANMDGVPKSTVSANVGVCEDLPKGASEKDAKKTYQAFRDVFLAFSLE